MPRSSAAVGCASATFDLEIATSSTFSAFQEHAFKALVTDFLPEDQYAKASGLMQLASSAQYLISPFLAGILLTIIDISTFLIASVIIIWIRKTLGTNKTEQPKQNFITDFKEGIYEFSKNKGVVWLVGISLSAGKFQK